MGKTQMSHIGGKLKGMRACGSLRCDQKTWAQFLGDTATCLNGVCWNLRDAMISWSDASDDIPKSAAPNCTGAPTAMGASIAMASTSDTVDATDSSAEFSKVLASCQRIIAKTSSTHRRFSMGASAAGLGMVLFFFKGRQYRRAVIVNEFDEMSAYAPLPNDCDRKAQAHTAALWSDLYFSAAVVSALAHTWCIMQMLATSQIDILAHDISIPLRSVPARIHELSKRMPSEGVETTIWNEVLTAMHTSLARLTQGM